MLLQSTLPSTLDLIFPSLVWYSTIQPCPSRKSIEGPFFGIWRLAQGVVTVDIKESMKPPATWIDGHSRGNQTGRSLQVTWDFTGQGLICFSQRCAYTSG